ncbi:MAG: alpha-L-fucosidase, partial [Bacteroidota bacterium]
MNKYFKSVTLFFLLLYLPVAHSLAQETNAEYHERMKWWDEGRIGMFLHWGVYSTFGGDYNGQDFGKEMGNASAEWIYLKSGMPREDYEKAALNWNPYKYNSEEWALTAKNAGMTYMVLTAKHHDGYALFDSKASDWNVVKHSTIKRDLVKEYVDACKKYDIKVGFYYSHEKDWTHHIRKNSDRQPLSKEYIEFSKKQITELLTQYGKIDLIWFDTPVKEHEKFNKMCAGLVRKYQPECIINGRIGNNLGDYKNIGDRAIVNPGEEGYMESIMTMRLNWGFDKNDDFWKSSDELIKMVSKSACRGSNFLLNIGPSPEGRFPIEDQVRLSDLGKWMKLNGEAIYKTKGNPFGKEHSWGSISISKNKPVVYVHLLNWIGG